MVDSTSFTKTVKFSIEIWSKMILIGNYTCSRSINEKSHLCLAKHFAKHFAKLFAKHACDFSLILLEPCNFLYKLDEPPLFVYYYHDKITHLKGSTFEKLLNHLIQL